MFGFNYLKTNPTEFVLHHAGGRLVRSGAGQAFAYFRPTASIAIVPIGTMDAPFIFNEMTADFQSVTVQGQASYRIVDPVKTASLLNYTVNAKHEFVSDDPEKLPARIVGLLQEVMHAQVQSRGLREAIKASEDVATHALAALKASGALDALGVEVLALSVAAIKPMPEMSRALEAEARETLLRQADDAIYLRRNNAVEQERRIKENELSTEIAVESKKRQIRETKVAADLAIESKEQEIREAKLAGQVRLEDERKRLVAAQSENARAEADAQAYGLAAALKPVADLDPALVQALSAQSTDPRVMLSLALKELANNAGKINTLTITPELMAAVTR